MCHRSWPRRRSGLLVDRARQPRWILAVAAVVFGGALAVVALGLGTLPLPVVLAVLFIGGCCGPAVTGALTSQLSRLVPSERLSASFGLEALTYNISGIAGPALAAVLAGTFGAQVAVLALAGCAVVGAAALATLPLRPTSPDVDGKKGARLNDGLLAVIRDRILAVVTGASSIGQIGAGALPVIAAVLATRLHNPAFSGWLMTAVAVGALLGSLAWTFRPAAVRHAPLVGMASLVGVGVPLAVAAATTSSLSLSLVLFGVSGLFNGPFAGAIFATRQDRAPEAVRAQVFTIGAGLKLTAAAAGAAAAGLLSSTATGVQLILAAAFLVGSGVVGGALLLLARDRQTEVRHSPADQPASARRPMAPPTASRTQTKSGRPLR